VQTEGGVKRLPECAIGFDASHRDIEESPGVGELFPWCALRAGARGRQPEHGEARGEQGDNGGAGQHARKI
jgi:hypothetical protein